MDVCVAAFVEEGLLSLSEHRPDGTLPAAVSLRISQPFLLVGFLRLRVQRAKLHGVLSCQSIIDHGLYSSPLRPP